MASAAEEKSRASAVHTGSASSLTAASLLRNGSVNAVGTALREGHSLAQAAIADGELLDSRPLGPSLAAVLAAMLEADVRPASDGKGGEFGAGLRIVIHIAWYDFMCAGKFIAVPPKHCARAQAAVRRVSNVLPVPTKPQWTQVPLP